MSRYFVFVVILLLLGIGAQATNNQGFPDGTYQIVKQQGAGRVRGVTLTFRRGFLTFKACNNYCCIFRTNQSQLKVGTCMGTKMFCTNSREYELVGFFKGMDHWKKEGPLYVLGQSTKAQKFFLRKI